MKLFETHAHLDLPDYNNDRDVLINKCFAGGIEYIINIGFNKETSLSSLELARKYLHLFATVGYHPHEATEFDAEVIKRLARDSNVLAIGETGLDFFRNLAPFPVQREVFFNQIRLALEYDLPLVVHDRNAHQECYRMMKKENVKHAVLHCFSGDLVFARQVLDEGWMISFTASITYPNSILDDVIRITPLEQMMVETDCPYLSPQSHRGKRNSPLLLHHVVEKIAQVKEMTPNDVAEKTFDNAYRFFRIPPDPVKRKSTKSGRKK
ncbi:MAG: TatD family hydrolase [Candidatus Cloacimonetes bacterium]|nr:TatD family hydrolase [Candidatus Cloacimonadota bacterium]